MTYPRSRASSAGRVEHEPFTVFRRAFATNSTATAMEFSVPTTTQPTTATAGVHELEPGKRLIVKPYGTDTDADAFRLGVQLWHPMYDKLSTTKSSEDIVWIPTIVGLYDCTLDSSTVPAAAVGALATTDMFCNIVVGCTGTLQRYEGANPSNKFDDFIPSGGSTPTKFSMMTPPVITQGAKYVQFFVQVDGSAGTTAASGNALFAVV